MKGEGTSLKFVLPNKGYFVKQKLVVLVVDFGVTKSFNHAGLVEVLVDFLDGIGGGGEGGMG